MLDPRRFRIDLSDADGTPVVADVADVLRLTISERWMADGAWQLTVPSDSLAARAAFTVAPLRLTLVDRESGRVVFSGQAQPSDRGLANVWEQTVDQTSGALVDQVTVTGWDDWAAILGAVPAIPRPDLLPAGGPKAYDDLDGPASTVAWQYVDRNIGSLAAEDRGWPTLVLAPDPVAGPTVDERARYWPLGPLVARVLRAGELSATVRQGDPGTTHEASQVFEIRESVDRSGSVVFSVSAGSIVRASIKREPCPVNCAWVLGQGDLAARDIEFVDPGGRGQRREGTYDRSDLPTPAQLIRAGETWLDERAGAPSIRVEPAETVGARYGDDFALGDFVGVDFAALSGTVRVSGADWTISPDGVERRIQLGAGRVTGVDGLVARFAEIDGRIDRQALN